MCFKPIEFGLIAQTRWMKPESMHLCVFDLAMKPGWETSLYSFHVWPLTLQFASPSLLWRRYAWGYCRFARINAVPCLCFRPCCEWEGWEGWGQPIGIAALCYTHSFTTVIKLTMSTRNRAAHSICLSLAVWLREGFCCYGWFEALRYIYIYIYIYTHAFMYVYIYIYIYTHIHMHIHIQIHIHTYIHTYVHTYIPTYLPTYLHTYIHTHIHII